MTEEKKKPEEKKASEEDLSENVVFAILSYIPVLCIVPLLTQREDDFVMFHARQGLVLFLALVAISFFRVLPYFGRAVWNLSLIIYGLTAVYAVAQILMDKKWEIPLISDWAEKLKT